MRIEPQNIVLNGHEYTIGRLDLFQSLNLTRLVSPFLPVLFNEVFKNVLKTLFVSKQLKEANVDDVLEEISAVVALCVPVLTRFAQLPKDDFETIVKVSLGCIERKDNDRWFKVMEGGTLRYSDIDQYEALNLVLRVIIRELRPTITAFLNSAQEAV